MFNVVTMPYRNKAEFLNIPEVKNFVEYLGKLISLDENFSHEYNGWKCDSLLDAKQKYQWFGTYGENKKILQGYRDGLKSALDQGNEEQVFIFAIKIMDWGNVHKGCVEYVINKYEEKSLCKSISLAVSILDSTTYDLERFDQIQLRMDSGLTKVYSLASSQSIIYDSRVTAALLLIGYRFFGKETLLSLSNLELFAGGKSTGKTQKRMETDEHKAVSRVLEPFKVNRREESIFPVQAHFNLISNWMLQEAIRKAHINSNNVLERWEEENSSGLLRAVESSLFMIGADIRLGLRSLKSDTVLTENLLRI